MTEKIGKQVLEECVVDGCQYKKHIFSDQFCGYHRGRKLAGTHKTDMKKLPQTEAETQ